MRVTIHQPDLLPYSGFWFKMATSDKFVIARHDQFQKHGYQRRVKMRDTWCSLQLVGKPSMMPISSVEVRAGWQERLVAVIRGRYSGAKYWRGRGVDLCDAILACDGHRLDEVNVGLIELVRDILGLRTELVFTPPPTHASVDRLIEQVLMADGTEYLAGAGGAAYMGDDAANRFRAQGIELAWSNHMVTTGDSIVTVLLDYDDPIGIVMQHLDKPCSTSVD